MFSNPLILILINILENQVYFQEYTFVYLTSTFRFIKSYFQPNFFLRALGSLVCYLIIAQFVENICVKQSLHNSDVWVTSTFSLILI